MQPLDWVMIGGYFLVVAGIAWWASRKQDTTEDYFLAGRNVGFFVIGSSLFASNIGSEHIVGLSGQGATTGMAMAHWELHAWLMVLLAWVFVPFYYRSGVYTVPEFVEKRFGPSARMLLSVVSLVAYIFTKVSVTVYAGAVVFQALLPETFGSPEMAFWVGAFSTVLLTGVYTVFGGFRAVLYTDTIQAVILLTGSACITAIGLSKLGGWGELQNTLAPYAKEFALWRPNSDPDFPWLGVMIASPIIGVWYWCTDQYIVQRTLSAKDLKNARRGALWGGFLKSWAVLIFLLPGMIAFALFKSDLIVLPTKEGGDLDGDLVFASTVKALLPVGLRGLVVAGLIAALMSSLSSLFNSSASLFTVDLYEKLRPARSQKHYVNVGRVATVVVVALGLLWIPVMKQVAGGGLYQYLQQVQGYLAPPITAVFLLGLFYKRTNLAGALWGLGLGFLLGMGKLTVQTFYGHDDPKKSADPALLADIGDFNFLYYCGVLFAVSLVVVLVASWLTAPPRQDQLDGLVYGQISDEDRAELAQARGPFEYALSFVVVGLVLGMYLYFSFWL